MKDANRVYIYIHSTHTHSTHIIMILKMLIVGKKSKPTSNKTYIFHTHITGCEHYVVIVRVTSLLVIGTQHVYIQNTPKLTVAVLSV
jgi:hypothetical protein